MGAAAPGAVAALGEHLTGLAPDTARSGARARRVAAAVLAASPNLHSPACEQIAPDDLWLLFRGYDREFFAGRLAPSLGGAPRQQLRLRLSTRMTSAGGKLAHRPAGTAPRFELAVSSHLLFTNFAPGAPPVPVNGLPCTSRLDALQRIFEHELVHLAEVLVWNRTSCRSPRFLALAHALFGHTEVTHRLPTPRQHALQVHGLRAGDTVQFLFEGRRLRGFVNRITKRATVLVPDPAGQPYSDGSRYAKFYVPVEALQRR